MTACILVVDDEADLAETCARLLRRQGHGVTCAASCREALAALDAARPTLIVADLHLPDGDGLDVVRAARALPAPLPVIIVTGYPSPASRRQAFEAGAAAYVTKPFSIATFSALVTRMLEGH